MYVFISVGCWSRFTDEDGMHMLSFSQFCQTVSKMVVPNYTPTSKVIVLIALHFCQHLELSVFLILIHSHGCIARCQ